MVRLKVFVCLLLYIPLTQASWCQEVKFSLPLKGVPGKDFFIDYYVDHDSTGGIQDIFCGDKTYDGHKGTDFLIRGYKAMDSGVYIYAAADGRVFDVYDGMYDRNKFWVSGGLGNHVSIVHNNEISTYYGHMMKHSPMVKVGDSVKAGQPIGKVGSSGYSSYPHLHFEVRDSANRVIDPFAGNCAPGHTSYWITQPAYDTSLFVISDGFVPYIPKLDTLQEGYRVTDTFNITTDKVVCFWALLHGAHKGDNMRVEWYTPDHHLYYQYSYKWKTNWWHSYTWPNIQMPEITGTWTAKLYVNNRLIAARDFYVMQQGH